VFGSTRFSCNTFLPISICFNNKPVFLKVHLLFCKRFCCVFLSRDQPLKKTTHSFVDPTILQVGTLLTLAWIIPHGPCFIFNPSPPLPKKRNFILSISLLNHYFSSKSFRHIFFKIMFYEREVYVCIRGGITVHYLSIQAYLSVPNCHLCSGGIASVNHIL